MQPPENLVIRTNSSYRVVKIVFAAMLIFFLGGGALALLMGAKLEAMLFPTLTMGSMLLFIPVILWLSIRGAASAERSRINHFFNQQMWATWQYGDDQWQQIADERREMGRKVRGFAKGYAEAEAIRLSKTPRPRIYIASNGVYHEIDGFTSLNNVNKAEFVSGSPAYLKFSGWFGGGRNAYYGDYLVPVPYGLEAEAESLIQRFQSERLR